MDSMSRKDWVMELEKAERFVEASLQGIQLHEVIIAAIKEQLKKLPEEEEKDAPISSDKGSQGKG